MMAMPWSAEMKMRLDTELISLLSYLEVDSASSLKFQLETQLWKFNSETMTLLLHCKIRLLAKDY